MSADDFRLPLGRDQRMDRRDRLGRLRAIEEDPGRTLDDGVEVAAEPERSGRLREQAGLQRRQAEVLVRRRHKSGAVGVEPAKSLVRDGAEQENVVLSSGAQSAQLRPAADDDELLRLALPERPHDRRDVLVRQEARDAEDEPRLYSPGLAARPGGIERRRRRQDFRVDAVDPVYLGANGRRVNEVAAALAAARRSHRTSAGRATSRARRAALSRPGAYRLGW